MYGDQKPLLLLKWRGPFLHISLYGVEKLACEWLISSYCPLFDMRACVFRLGNVVGVIFDFIDKLRWSPEELERLGDGKQEKPFFLVEDCIDGMVHAYLNHLGVHSPLLAAG